MQKEAVHASGRGLCKLTLSVQMEALYANRCRSHDGGNLCKWKQSTQKEAMYTNGWGSISN